MGTENLHDALHRPTRLPVALIVTACCLIIFGSDCVAAQTYESAHQAYVDKDYKSSRRQLEALAGDDTPAVDYLLGSQYVSAQGGSRKTDRGIELIRSAASKGNITALYYLGSIYFSGDHRFSTAEQARTYLETAAGLGSADARAILDQHPLPSREPSIGEIESPKEPIGVPDGVENQPERVAPMEETADEVAEQALEDGTVGSPVDLLADLQPSVDKSDAVVETVEDIEGSNRVFPILAFVILIAIVWYAFSGIKCPRCRKRRVSTRIDRENVGQYVTSVMKNVTSRTTHHDSHSSSSNRYSETNSQVPVQVTVREFIDTYQCQKCENVFTRKVSVQM